MIAPYRIINRIKGRKLRYFQKRVKKMKMKNYQSSLKENLI